MRLEIPSPSSSSQSGFAEQLTRGEAHAARAFFRAISPKKQFQNGCLAVVTHLLEDRMPLLEALEEIAPIACIIPKPHSKHPPTVAKASQKWRVFDLTRDQL